MASYIGGGEKVTEKGIYKTPYVKPKLLSKIIFNVDTVIKSIMGRLSKNDG